MDPWLLLSIDAWPLKPWKVHFMTEKQNAVIIETEQAVNQSKFK